MENKVKIRNENKEQMLNFRENGIGGSDIPVICEVSPWGSRLEKWLEKTGQQKPTFDENTEMRFFIGSELEELVNKLICKELSKQFNTEIKSRKTNFTYTKDGFKLANPDRIVNINGKMCVIECKTANSFAKDEWGPDDQPTIPINYLYQINWYLGILNLEIAYIGCLFGGNEKFVIRTHIFDEKLFKEQEQKAEEFWELVKSMTPPKATGNDLTYLAKSGIKKEESIEINDELIREYVALDEDIKFLKKTKITPLENQLKNKKAEIIQMLNGCDGYSSRYTIKNTIVETEKFDKERFLNDHPDMNCYFKKEKSYNKITVKENKE